MAPKARDARRAVRPPADADALLSPEQVARRCGLSRRAAYRAIERGELRASRLCSRIRIRAADVEAWVEENQIEPSSHQTRFSRPSPLRSALRRLLAQPEHREGHEEVVTKRAVAERSHPIDRPLLLTPPRVPDERRQPEQTPRLSRRCFR